MLANPYVITVNAIAKSLNLTGTGPDTASYATADRAFRLLVSHSYGRKVRRVIQMQHDNLVANPLISGQFVNSNVKVHLVIESPVGYDATVLKQDVDGFLASLTASSGAVVAKIIGGES